jgi:lysophospholipase L1-like esterase
MKRRIFHSVIFILFSGLMCSAQGIYKPLPDLPFANLDSNKIIFPGRKNAMDPFFRKIDKLFFSGKGQVNIVHIGGSHIQADIISHRFRTHLLSIQPGIVSGRGLVFPYSIARTNNPWNYKTTYSGKWTPVRNVQKELKAELGVSGIAVITSDSTAQFTIEMRQNIVPVFRFHRIKILCTGDTTGVEPVLLYNDIKIKKTTYDTLNKTYIFELPVQVSEFTVGFEGFTNSGQSIGITGVILENGKPGIIYHSIGINGASVPSYLKCVNFERDLAQLKPDLVILAVGINDASASEFSSSYFETNYKELISRIRRVNPYCSILFTVNNDSYRRTGRRSSTINDNNAAAREVFFKLATEYHGALWDLYTIMGGRGSVRDWEGAGLAKADKVHFTGPGYELLGDLLFNAFWQAYSDYLLGTNQHQRQNHLNEYEH